LPPVTDDTPFVPPDLVKVEAQSIDKFATLVVEYRKQFEPLRNDASPDPRQIIAVESKLKNLKTLFPQFQSSARAVVTKLKNAGKWTGELDSFFETAAAKRNVSTEFIDFVKASGGFRKSFENAIVSLGGFSDELDRDETALREIKNKKVGWLNSTETLFILTGYASALQLSCNTCLTLFVALELCSVTLFLAPGCSTVAAAYLGGRCFRSECRNFAARLVWKLKPTDS